MKMRLLGVICAGALLLGVGGCISEEEHNKMKTELEGKLSAANTDLGKSKADLVTAQEKNTQLQAELDRAKQQIEDYRKSDASKGLADARAENARLTAEVSRLKTDLADARAEARAAKADAKKPAGDKKPAAGKNDGKKPAAGKNDGKKPAGKNDGKNKK